MCALLESPQGSSALHMHDPHAVVKDVYKAATQQAAVAQSEYDPDRCMQVRRVPLDNNSNKVKIEDQVVQPISLF